MTTYDLLTAAKPASSRPQWDAGYLSVRVEHGNLEAAAHILDTHAKARGFKITEVALAIVNGTEAAYARGAK